eukprot:TRINITY_DN8700_c0_g1_i2.p1 TRINITY_DN8700_c0_g1~~TRINITY_DN8700_c0_g1_i2.p1  ORF type:complete len:511 (+),score=55.63 TRINITY_DN8700_c0_g1_i2:881-2413(+)
MRRVDQIDMGYHHTEKRNQRTIQTKEAQKIQRLKEVSITSAGITDFMTSFYATIFIARNKEKPSGSSTLVNKALKKRKNRMRLSILFLGLFICGAFCRCNFWSELQKAHNVTTADEAPARRSWAVGVPIHDTFLIFGGESSYGKDIHEDLWQYKPIQDTWNKLASGPEDKFWASTGDMIGGRLFIFGGRSADKSFHNELWEYTYSTNKWNELTEKAAQNGQLPPIRNGHSSTAIGDEIWVFGGWDDTRYFNDLWKFNIDTTQWTNLTSADPETARPSPRNGHSAVTYSGRLIIFGGFKHIPEPTEFYNDVWNYENDAWNRIKPIGIEKPSKRFDHSAVVYGKFMVVFGGSSDPNGRDFLNDLWKFDFEREEWEDVKLDYSLAPSARQAHTAVVLGSQMYIFGGLQTWTDNHHANLNDVWVQDLAQCQDESYRAKYSFIEAILAISSVTLVLLVTLMSWVSCFIVAGLSYYGYKYYYKKNGRTPDFRYFGVTTGDSTETTLFDDDDEDDAL